MPHIVFVTAYDRYALKAFDVNAIDYLLKPVEEQMIERTILKKDTRIILVDVDDIVYAYIIEGVVFVVTEMLEGMTRYRTLEELEADLDDQAFWRVHRGYIANINRVSEVVPWFSGTYRLLMDGAEKHEVPLSRTQAKKLRKVIKW